MLEVSEQPDQYLFWIIRNKSYSYVKSAVIYKVTFTKILTAMNLLNAKTSSL